MYRTFIGCYIALCVVSQAGQISKAVWQGRIVDRTGSVVQTAAVTVERLDKSLPPKAIAAHQGVYTIDDIDDGIYSIEIRAPGFLNCRLYPVRVTSPYHIVLDVQLQVGPVLEGGLDTEKAAHFVGTLRTDGVPLDMAQVCVRSAKESAFVRCTATNRIGQYWMTLPPDKYLVWVTHSEKRLWSGSVDMSYGGEFRDKVMVKDN